MIGEDVQLPGYKETGRDVDNVEAQEREFPDEKYPVPTEEEKIRLRRVHGTVPWIAWMLCIVEFAERASYYGASQIFSNFMQFPLPKGKCYVFAWNNHP